MTLSNRAATEAYLHALNNMPNTRPGLIASLADAMCGDAFDKRDLPVGVKKLSTDAMMDIETRIFVSLCEENHIDWRLLVQ